MTTPAHGNFSESSGKPLEGGFEASGMSPDEADRLAAAFKPSWEFDEAPFAQGNAGLDAPQIDALAGGGVAAEVLGNLEARTVAPRAPPARVETHEPEVSVIIDRSITSADMDAQRQPPASVRPPPPVQSPFAAPAYAPQAPTHRVAPVFRAPRSPDDSIEIPASLRKSNKGLFIGLGVAVIAAGLVFVVHGAMTSSSDTPSASTGATATATPSDTAADMAQRAGIPPVPAAPAAAAGTAATQAQQTAPQTAPQMPTAAPAPVGAAPSQQHYAAAPAPHAQPHPPAPHHAAPRNPPKQPGGGIVRDVPF